MLFCDDKTFMVRATPRDTVAVVFMEMSPHTRPKGATWQCCSPCHCYSDEQVPTQPLSLDPETTVAHTVTPLHDLGYEQNNTENTADVPGKDIQCCEQMNLFVSTMWTQIFSKIVLFKLIYSEIGFFMVHSSEF